MHTEQVTIYREDEDEDVDVYVDFWYTPGERATYDCPGCDPEIEIDKVTNYAGVKLDLTDDEISQVFDELWRIHESNND